MVFAYNFVHFAFEIYYFLILANVVLSWVAYRRGARGTAIINFIYEMTEPYLGIFRRILPPTRFGVDFSPILAIFALYVLESLVYRLLAIIF